VLATKIPRKENGMTVQLTDEEFAVVYEALRIANSPYSKEEVPHLVAMEAKAWKIIESLKHKADLLA
jgi:hypothetical protein